MHVEFCVRPIGLVYCFVTVFFSLVFNFDFLSRPTSQEIGWEERIRYDLFSVLNV